MINITCPSRVNLFIQVPFGIVQIQQSRGIYVDYIWDIFNTKKNVKVTYILLLSNKYYGIIHK